MLAKRGMTVKIVATDPWELVTAIGSGPFEGAILNVDAKDHKSIVIRLDKPIRYRKIEAHFLVASARHVGGDFLNASNNTLFCNLVSLAQDEAQFGIIRPYSDATERLRFIGDVSWTETR
jgi:hypothetical protein